MKTPRCPLCGQGHIEPLARPGRSMPHRQMRAVPLPDDLALPTCTSCGEEFLDGRQMEAIDAALETAYRGILRRQSQEALAAMTEVRPQRDWEHVLGLSTGYLSKVKRAGKEVSATLTALLSLLARDPTGRGQELEMLWRGEAPKPVPRAPVLQFVGRVNLELPAAANESRRNPVGHVELHEVELPGMAA